VKLYLDEGLPARLAVRLRAGGLAAVSTHEAGNVGLDDRAQLQHAAGQGRTLVTADVLGFSALAVAAVAANATHAGIILVSAGFRPDELGAMGRGIREIAARYPRGLGGMVVYLQPPRRSRLATSSRRRARSRNARSRPAKPRRA
jgi:hypothetical protein